MKRLLVVLLVWISLPLGSAQAQGVQAQGWWTQVNKAGLPAVPAPPDVGETDLLLQGGDPVRVLPDTGVVDRAPQPTALTALRFAVDPGAAVGSLVLAVSAGAQALDVRAYRATRAWEATQNGAIQDAPTFALDRYATGRLTGEALVFPDVGRLISESGELSVVLVAGPADRVVVHAPTATALTVTPATASPVVDVPVSEPQPVPPVPPRVELATLQPVVDAPSTVSTPAPQAVPAPVAAPAPVALVGLSPGVTRLVSDDSRSRFVVLAEAVLVLVFFGLLGQGPMSRLARDEQQGEAARGVGRFQAVRVGRAPRL